MDSWGSKGSAVGKQTWVIDNIRGNVDQLIVVSVHRKIIMAGRLGIPTRMMPTLNSSVVEAVEVRGGADGFVIKMRDGMHLRCARNNPQEGHLPDYAPHPAIVLKMEDGTWLFLPIIILEMPSVLLMAAVRNVPIGRLTMYQVVNDMIEKMGYTVKLVRVTKRVHEAYFSELHLIKIDNKAECFSFDLRPSDDINIAMRCKVPIQVNKFLAYSDGMRVIDSIKVSVQSSSFDGQLFTELDRMR